MDKDIVTIAVIVTLHAKRHGELHLVGVWVMYVGWGEKSEGVAPKITFPPLIPSRPQLTGSAPACREELISLQPNTNPKKSKVAFKARYPPGFDTGQAVLTKISYVGLGIGDTVPVLSQPGATYGQPRRGQRPSPLTPCKLMSGAELGDRRRTVRLRGDA